jgi:hypothetical protein
MLFVALVVLLLVFGFGGIVWGRELVIMEAEPLASFFSSLLFFCCLRLSST